jgi:hypothetical protein
VVANFKAFLRGGVLGAKVEAMFIVENFKLIAIVVIVIETPL